MTTKEIEYAIDDISQEIKKRKSELDPEFADQDDLINELELMEQDLTNAVNRIEKINRLENKL